MHSDVPATPTGNRYYTLWFQEYINALGIITTVIRVTQTNTSTTNRAPWLHDNICGGASLYTNCSGCQAVINMIRRNIAGVSKHSKKMIWT